jgi:hypothetical protein
MNTLFKYAIEIERTRSITKAAENLYMAQPNLSKAIKEVEETVGFSIFRKELQGGCSHPKGASVSGLCPENPGRDRTDQKIHGRGKSGTPGF